MGVRRAMDLAEKSLHEVPAEGVYSLGPLIHNPQVMEDFDRRGLSVINEQALEGLGPGARVIIRAHGVSPQIEDSLLEKKIDIVDATCPRVHASQKLVAKARQAGRAVFLAGDRGHGEIRGLAGHDASCSIFENEKEVRNFLATAKAASIPRDSSPILIPQTTFSKTELDVIARLLKEHWSGLEVANTICRATEERQKSLLELLEIVDAVVVVGGKNSANTRRLHALALERIKKSILIETPEELPEWIFAEDRVGLTAGASTPDSIIQAVEERLLVTTRSKT